MAEVVFLSHSTHRYLTVHTWVGLQHSDTMKHTHREGERERDREGGKEDTRQEEMEQNEK